MMTGPVHVYWSTACRHGECGQCRVTCKFCHVICVCDCHHDEKHDEKLEENE